MRLDKFLSTTGMGTRTEVKQLIKKKRVTVNGIVAKNAKQQVDEQNDVIQLDDHCIQFQRFYYYVLHKPQGVITATTDKTQRTVMDLFAAEDYQSDLFPVGRLDKDTTGLLLITNNGQLAHELLAPKKHVPKVYEALIEGIVTSKEVEQFAAGLTLNGDELAKPAQLEIVQTYGQNTHIRLTIHEGKFHQVKRMFKAVGMKVLRLHRTQMASLVLPPALKEGDYRKLTKDEQEALFADITRAIDG